MKCAVVIVLGILLAVAVTTEPALACEDHNGEHVFASGFDFGQHVADEMTGMLDGTCNPGIMHSGYSPWAH